MDNRYLTAQNHLSRVDEHFARAIESVGPRAIEARPCADVYSSLARSIIYQQLSTRAAGTIYKRYLAALGDVQTAERVLSIPHNSLRSAGISNAKCRALKELADSVSTGNIPDISRLKTLDNNAVIACLTRVWGIGDWTAHMFLIFCLGRLDVLPTSDVGVRNGIALIYKTDPESIDLIALGESWRPYRSVASWYAWQVLDRNITL